MTNTIMSIFASIGLTAILIASIYLFFGVALESENDTLNRIFAAICGLILFAVFLLALIIAVAQ